MALDKKDCIILDMLQENCRVSLTKIAKEIDLSVDSTKKRVEKLMKTAFYPKIQLRPRNFGYKDIVEIKIKLNNQTQEEINEFIKFLQEHPYVVEIISISGENDFTLVIIAKDSVHLGTITSEIRVKFSRIIANWSESLTKCVYKFEEYDMKKIMGFNDE